MLGFWHTNYQIETYKISGVRKVFAKGRVKNVSNGKDMRITAVYIEYPCSYKFKEGNV